MVMFDLPPPLQCKGIEAYERTWELLFRYHKPGTAFDIQEITVTAGRDVAFAVAIMPCCPDSSSNPADTDGFLFRLTVGLRNVNGDWCIAHEHHSVPATDAVSGDVGSQGPLIPSARTTGEIGRRYPRPARRLVACDHR